jgi:hypothetical protein
MTEDFLELPSEERTKRNFLSLELLICEVHDRETGETGWLPYRELQTGTFSAGSRTAAAERAVRRFFAAEREEISDHAVDAAIVRLMKSVRVEPIEELSRKFPEKNVKSLIAREFLAVQRSEGGREYVVYVP